MTHIRHIKHTAHELARPLCKQEALAAVETISFSDYTYFLACATPAKNVCCCCKYQAIKMIRADIENKT